MDQRASAEARRLAMWMVAHYSNERDPLTHLKLQKLCFYGYCAALAYGLEAELGGEIPFEAWKHGPVNRAIYEGYKGYGASTIPRTAESPGIYSPQLEELLTTVLRIYGRLDTYSIRDQSHLETPWREAFESGGGTIPTEALRRHFRLKWMSKRVGAPEYLGDRGSFGLDGIPTPTYESLKALADVLEL